MNRVIALGYRLGFVLACSALLAFLLGEAVLPEDTEIDWVINWLAMASALLLVAAGLIDAVVRRYPAS